MPLCQAFSSGVGSGQSEVEVALDVIAAGVTQRTTDFRSLQWWDSVKKNILLENTVLDQSHVNKLPPDAFKGIIGRFDF